MIGPMILSTLLGAVLGTRFKVLVLFPAMLVGATMAIGEAVAQGAGFGAGLLGVIETAFALQMGFLGGTLASAAAQTPRVQGPGPGVATPGSAC
jgi:hypothetical protein